MDYLAANVSGRIPVLSELTEPAQSLAALQGLSSVTAHAAVPKKP